MLRRLKNLLLATLALLAVCALLTYGWLRTSLPETSGTLRVAGAREGIEIWRDRYAVTHVFAQSEPDAYFGLGFAHAQDRLWQMELNRRIAAGRTAEVVGEAGLPLDRMLRTLGVRRNAERIYANLDAQTRELVQSYCDGINAWLEQQEHSASAWPPEFLLMSVRPERWTPPDVVGWYTMLAWDLSGNWQNELARMRLTTRLDPGEINEIMPPAPGEHYPDTANYAAIYRGLSGVARRLAQYAPALPSELGVGSNNWVVSGARTVTGKPLLANDPHLAFTAPSIWYLAHLHAPGFDAAGGSIPGVPSMVLGHNDRIAWGATSTGPDTQDLYIEMLDERGRVLTPAAGWRNLESREEKIKVKGGAETTIVVRESRHGPLISDVVTSAGEAVPEGYAIALQWTALRPDDRTVRAGFAISRSRGWDEFVSALHDFHAPQLTFVYADVDGNIGMIAPARVPVRKHDNDLHGLAPAQGWVARYDWQGFIPFDDLPRWYNPAGGALYSANSRIAPDNPAYPLAYEWIAPFRANRIAELLDTLGPHSASTFAAMQADVQSESMLDFVRHVTAVAPADPREREILAALSAWDGRMDGTRPEPLIMAAWLRELGPLVYADELGPSLFRSYWADRFTFLRNVLDNRDGQQRWCDDITTRAEESCAGQSARALHQALAWLAQRYGEDWRAWRWDKAHYAVAEHRPLSRVPMLSPLFEIRRPLGGDANTLDVASYRVAEQAAPFAAHHGPGLRAIYDTSDWNQSLFIASTGQSGNVLSRHYADYADAWSRNRYIPLRTDRSALEQESQKLLLLPR